ncbi:lipoprotein [Massilia sp. UMI-21]|nr:lipoprotein [Massilia sp. UMI-21]
MNSTIARGIVPIAGAGLVAVFLAGCGQTGPLYMPTPPAKPAPAADTPRPAPPVPSNNASIPAPTR